ncbi:MULTISPECIES: hypothetical protein [Cyanophyceae]|uniref:Uncharacterized protein n=1 Tax=Leptolyngbya subtilissima DQ-A4 TaxID=2933933 RepID=A0ABV0KA69_9CYAN|nr:hypothetical protein [Nodosilinea sp. FACHB-141]MBD2115178.1 hypothetical protein [Nodosilinea sp. FACHB-141]
MAEYISVQPPGCADWPDEDWPTDQEASNPLFDLSNFENIRKLARAIACQNDMVDAGLLSGEIAYAYQHEEYNVACIKEVLVGSFKDDLEEVLAALADLSAAGKNNVAQVLTAGAQRALDQSREQFGSQSK